MPLVQSFMVHKLTLMPNHKLFADWSPTIKLLQGMQFSYDKLYQLNSQYNIPQNRLKHTFTVLSWLVPLRTMTMLYCAVLYINKHKTVINVAAL